MNPTLTLFRKEFRQHGAFALAMVFLCLCFQIAYQMGERLADYTSHSDAFFYIALVVTAFYAGTAAALAYSTEHADNTFIFLRKLPISPATIACGKIGWVLCGTLLVLVGNLLLTAVWLGAVWTGGHFHSGIAIAAGTGIIEAFVWGIFWSTRCRSQMNALLATCLCASVTLILLGNIFQPNNTDVVDAYIAIMPHRIVVILVVGFFAVRGALRWFDFAAAQSPWWRTIGSRSRFKTSLGNADIAARRSAICLLFRYPQRVQSPFFALVHQHLRHTTLLYPLGILCFLILGAGWLLLYSDGKMGDLLWLTLGCCICIGGTVIFWGNIFGPDQRNDSYRFLSRVGIHEGTVWWSRMLPALLLYSFPLACLYFYAAMDNFASGWDPADTETWRDIFDFAAIFFTIWLIPAALGAFISISLRSQILAVTLTVAALSLPSIWVIFTFHFFWVSPAWTTVPLCLALLLASRIRAGYWLREKFTWRSRLIPLVPFFTVLLAILVALPFVRVYSVPYVSWAEVDAFFDQADLGDMRRSPEKRRALIEYIAKHNAVPPEYQSLYLDFFHMLELDPQACSFEEYLLLSYLRASEMSRHPVVFSDGRHFLRGDWDRQNLISYVPWESVRADRRLRLELVVWLVDNGYLPNEGRAAAMRRWNEDGRNQNAIFDADGWTVADASILDERNLSLRPLGLAYSAINNWYIDQGTLPSSLEELVEREYLEAIPSHPFTGELVQYHENALLPQDAHFAGALTVGRGGSSAWLGRSRDWWNQMADVERPYVQLGNNCLVIRLPEPE